MAYNQCNLSVLAYANGFTLWHYRTTDQVDGTGYFNPAVEMLRVGDMILANCDIDSAPSAGILLVTRSSDGIVDVTNLTRVGTETGES